MAKVHWTEYERKLVVGRIAGDMMTPGFDRGEFQRLFAVAQLALPEHRRRPWHSKLQAELAAKAREEYAQRRTTERARKEETRAPVPENETAEAPRLRGLETHARDLGSMLADELFAAFEERFKAAVSALIDRESIRARQQLAAVLEQPAPATAPPAQSDEGTAPQTTNRKLPRVLIVGTLPVWERKLLEEYEDCLDLVFFNDRNGSSGLDGYCRRAEHLVLNTQLARHSHQAVMRASGKSLTLTNGGLSAIKSKLDEIYLVSEDRKTVAGA